MIPALLQRIACFCAALLFATPLSAQMNVTAVLPNGREIHPAGNWIPLAPYPFALAVRPDGGQIAVPSIGFPFALNVIEQPSDIRPAVRRIPAGENNDPGIEVHAGVAYSPDGSLLYEATGDSGKIRAYRTDYWGSQAKSPWTDLSRARTSTAALRLRWWFPTTAKRSMLSTRATGAL